MNEQPAVRELVARPERLSQDPESLWFAVTTAECEVPDFHQEGDRERLDRLRIEVIRVATRAPQTLVAGFDRVLMCPAPSRALELLRRLGVLGVLLPEVDHLYGFHRSAPSHHKDLWTHTGQVIGQMPADPDLRWAALLHDVGKLATRSEDGSGKVTFWHHEELGGWIARGILARLMMPVQRLERIVFIVSHHGRVNAYEPQWSDRAVARLDREMGAGLADLLAFSRADFTTRRTRRRDEIRSQLDHLEERLRLLHKVKTRPRLPSGLGRHVSQRFGIHGPELGKVLRWLNDELIDGHVGNEMSQLLDHLEGRERL